MKNFAKYFNCREPLLSAVILNNCYLLLFLLVINSTDLFAQKNKTIEYDINDPKNPNCPCHQHQKLADAIYASIQKKSRSVIADQAIILSPPKKVDTKSLQHAHYRKRNYQYLLPKLFKHKRKQSYKRKKTRLKFKHLITCIK